MNNPFNEINAAAWRLLNSIKQISEFKMKIYSKSSSEDVSIDKMKLTCVALTKFLLEL